jgi:type IV pilus assembly protein PilM
MEQFNKARGGSGLANVVLYGFIEDYMKIVDALDGLDIKASVLGLPAQITGYENFEFTVFANAIGALYRRNKQTERINLLEVDRSTSKDQSAGISSMLTTAGILAAASAILIAAATGFIRLKAAAIDKETEGVKQECEELQKIVDANQVLHNRMDIIVNYTNYVKTVQLDIDTQPLLAQDKYDKIEGVLKDMDATYESAGFELKSGTYTINKITVKEQDDVKKLVDALTELDCVAYVNYTGYSGTGEKVEVGTGDKKEEKDDPVVIDSLGVIFMEEGE